MLSAYQILHSLSSSAAAWNFNRMQVKSDANPELQHERINANFSSRELSAVLYGGHKALERREKVAGFVESTPEFKDPKPVEFMSRPETYENAMRKAVAMTKYAEDLNPEDYAEIQYYEGLVMGGDPHPLSLHYVMFLPTLQNQCNDEQMEKWLPLAFNRGIIGTYAQTEMGHGTNLRNLETTATFDPTKQEFVIHTPTLTATKWWPGNLGKSANHAVVMAQLWTKGKCYGPHGFIVQLRDLETHQPLPGVRVGDIGPKFGYSSNDNGYLAFHQYRIPRDQMLMKNSRVEPDGTYVPPSHEKLSFGTMIFVRSVMLRSNALALAKAATISTRYSCVRRQGEIIPGKGEVKVLDYQTQQYRIFPELARSFAFFVASAHMREVYSKSLAEIRRGNVNVLPELHALSSGLKAFITWEMAKGIEQCRLSCGGHGYLQASGLPTLYTTEVGACTYEGDNIVLLLQVAKFLMKAARAHGKDVSPTASYLKKPIRGRTSALDQSLRIEDLLEGFEHVARRKISRCAAALDQLKSQGYSPEEAWNRSGVSLCKAARAHVLVFLTSAFHEWVENLADSQIKSALSPLRDLFIFDYFVRKSSALLQDQFINKQQLEFVRDGITRSLAAIRPNAVALTDSWDFRDRELRSVLGRRDGWVYENLMKWAQHSTLNQKEVLDAHHTYFGPMMKEARSKL